jgi:hypothetical protein
MTDGPLDRTDWHWSTRVSPAPAHTAEWWARAVFEDGPAPVRWFVLFGWVVVLRLRLGPRSADGYVLGWRIVEDTPERFVLGVESTMLVARLVITTGSSAAEHATYLRYCRRRARVIWPLIAPLHKIIIVSLLRRAARA